MASSSKVLRLMPGLGLQARAASAFRCLMHFRCTCVLPCTAMWMSKSVHARMATSVAMSSASVVPPIVTVMLDRGTTWRRRAVPP